MKTRLSASPRSDTVSPHSDWRPEWQNDRPCLYWYLTFNRDAVAAAVDPRLLAAIRQAPWLDPIPLEWTHLTLCDLGFVDQVPGDVVDRALQGLHEVMPTLELPKLTLGPAVSMESAIVLAAEPLDELRRLQQALRSVSEAAHGPGHEVVHRHEFWPHVSLGYANRSVRGNEVRALTDTSYHPSRTLPIEGLVLAAVTRHRRHYEWTAHSTFGTSSSRSSKRIPAQYARNAKALRMPASSHP